MTRARANELARVIPEDDLLTMLQAATQSLKDWSRPSNVNPALTLAMTMKIYLGSFSTPARDGPATKEQRQDSVRMADWKDFKHRRNMIWDFGGYLTDKWFFYEAPPAKKGR